MSSISKNLNQKQIISFEKLIAKEFEIKKHVNLNDIKSNMTFGRKWKILKNCFIEINFGMSLDRYFILKTMITTASVIDMIIIYSLRSRIRENVEFNFYDV